MDNDIPYLLLTPGPLTTSRGVRAAMQRDLSTWDIDYNAIVESVRRSIAAIDGSPETTVVLMQGSGTFGVEALLGTALPRDGRLLVLSNGAYGRRIAEIARRLEIEHEELVFDETSLLEVQRVAEALDDNPGITHVAAVHCETTSGMLNPLEAIGETVTAAGRVFLVDAMSSFGGIPLSLDSLHADFLVSSSNKCLQGVPGFSFVVARRAALEATDGQARSLSLDLYDQWREMEDHGGKWRFTSPTHALCALARALEELEEEGGVAARHARYQDNQQRLVAGMCELGFVPLLPGEFHSPIITAFLDPDDPRFVFPEFYDQLKARRFVIYPGKVTDRNTFRIGTIGHVFPDDIDELIDVIRDVGRTAGFIDS